MNLDDITLLENLYYKILNSYKIKNSDIEIQEKNLNFAINVKIKKNIKLDKLLDILKAFDRIEKYSSKHYSCELELYSPYLTLYMDKYDD